MDSPIAGRRKESVLEIPLLPRPDEPVNRWSLGEEGVREAAFRPDEPVSRLAVKAISRES